MSLVEGKAAVGMRAPTVLTLGGAAFIADPAGALFREADRLLVVADLHLEKGSSYARRGVLLPPYDTRTTLQRLARLVARYAPHAVLALGDSFHDGDAHGRLDVDDRAAIADLQRGRDWVWVTGNHDPAVPPGAGGTVAETLVLGGVTFRHEPGGTEAPEVAAHLHPVAKVRLRGRAVRRRCFVASERRCVLPALGAYAGGLNVRHGAFQPLFPDGLTAHLLGEERLYSIAGPLLVPD
ncbi:ligase-associated DNA damage response endonuclease PdeM [Chelatococcus sp. SYSU_G07232]|uniref:Ligase-associated DNA damage response endonuclease PdeM n=1 Tax=Chelatococcus albus TaxID=3047466 RepID=A0ABT7AF45_9HYPH|nr:ligase-associated DNA damage response endonuclease PdeM [Chelatococcus sp. SYSU_G07232]MDJ1157984.1 ligase-associated DNA damage response endonuclease PdeM [Chelatococcus sp. SYSU_G07232]